MTNKAPTNSPEMEAKRAVAWSEALRLGQFGYAELAIAAQTTERAVAFWARAWEAEGKIRCIAGHQARRVRKRFEITPQDEIHLVQAGDAIDQMWTVMRKSPQGFTPVDLTAQVALPLSIEEARAYCHMLLTAGYLRCVQKAQVTRKREAIYRLITITGVKAPRVKRLRCLIDANTGAIRPMVEARHG